MNLNIDKWHELGYKGNGVKIALIDKFDYHINEIINIKDKTSPLVDFKVYKPTFEGYKQILEYDPDILFISLSEVYGATSYINKMIANNTVVFKSAGNGGVKGETGMTIPKESYYVGAYKELNGKLTKSVYSAYGRGWVDIASIATYTSYAAPLAGCMFALFVEKYKLENDYRPTQEESKEFILSNCVDLEEDGKDLKSGNGLFVLPKEVFKVNKPERITDISLLHWKFRQKLKIVLENINKIAPDGVVFKVFESVRSDELQEYYYQQGRITEGSIITNVKTPTFHNKKVGLAADVVPYVNGTPKWDKTLLKILGEEAVKQGLTWGGNWTSFYDGAHIQLDGGLKSSDIRQGSRPSWFYEKECPQWKENAVQWALKEGVIDSYHDPLELLDIGTYLEIERKKRL